jgi:hypothetical protein
MQSQTLPRSLEERIAPVVLNFANWLDRFGEISLDHQTFFAGPIGGAAKSFYYRHPKVGILAVAPMIFCEALIPSARRFFYAPVRFPIADAHYAMGFAFLHQATQNQAFLEKAIHFLAVLQQTRCPGFEGFGWGYPFDWVTRNGVMEKETPLITTTPYAYEAFLQVYSLNGQEQWKEILELIVRHVVSDITDFQTSEHASSCSYTPFDKGGVINAAAYRAFLLTNAAQLFSNEAYWRIAERNIKFVLETQNADGSWYYAIDGVRDFVDHYHTCFVLKSLAKIHALTGHKGCLEAISRGISYYLANLFDTDGLPRPFSRAPRMTVYKRELYDCAECLNLCLLLRDRFPVLEEKLSTVLEGILNHWIKPDGSFRSRRLYFGWDQVPMHRWGQSQMFRSLAYYLAQEKRRNTIGSLPVVECASLTRS